VVRGVQFEKHCVDYEGTIFTERLYLLFSSCWLLGLAYDSALKMEAVCVSEMPVKFYILEENTI
jgi:hypothetical protein